ncbi:hypothetical protein F5Y19DRAFT_417325 [Xylariaceae sp. FL1651]|nr:hypothetical protein F5Y19DRAFT_417325 [Xylariaceae sp. FL1651]
MAASRPSSPCSSNGAQHRSGPYGVIDDLRTTSVLSSLSSLFLDEKFSDMTVTCKGCEFKVHRAIVCTQSPFFDKAISNGFKESMTRVIDLPDDDPDIFKLFLQFLYTGNYDDGVIPTYGKPSSVALMRPEEVTRMLSRQPGVRVFKGEATPETPKDDQGTLHETAQTVEEIDSEYLPEEDEPTEPKEEYDEFSGAESEYGSGDFDDDYDYDPNPKITEISKNSFESAMGSIANSHQDLLVSLRLYIMADKYDVPALRLLARDRFYRAAEFQWEFDDSFPDVVDELYSFTPETEVAMREIVCRLVGHRLKNEKVREKMQWVMRKHGDFSVGLINYMIERSSIIEWR